MKTRIYCPDIECDSCIRVLEKRIGKKEGVESFHIKADHMEISYDEKAITENDLINLVKEAGFRADTKPFERKTFSERFRDIKENKKKYVIEMRSLRYSISIFLIILGLQLVAYFGIFGSDPGFLSKYGLWMLYANLSISSIGGVLFHFFSYRTKYTCMTGMMIGMTIGMQTGMMIGAILGATNGFFMGALIGMLVSVAVGSIAGRCCGIMGVMEGMMAGVMGGTMGPMITVMMFSDNVHIFMPFYMVINMIIMWGLVYMVYEEAIEGKRDVVKKKIDFSLFASLCILVMAIMTFIMVYGPKSALLT